MSLLLLLLLLYKPYPELIALDLSFANSVGAGVDLPIAGTTPGINEAVLVVVVTVVVKEESFPVTATTTTRKQRKKNGKDVAFLRNMIIDFFYYKRVLAIT